MKAVYGKLCGHGMNDPMMLVALIKPAWHAQLLSKAAA